MISTRIISRRFNTWVSGLCYQNLIILEGDEQSCFFFKLVVLAVKMLSLVSRPSFTLSSFISAVITRDPVTTNSFHHYHHHYLPLPPTFPTAPSPTPLHTPPLPWQEMTQVLLSSTAVVQDILFLPLPHTATGQSNLVGFSLHNFFKDVSSNYTTSWDFWEERITCTC